MGGAPWLDAVPPPWFHVTVADVGFTDVLEPADADAVLAAVAEELAGQRAFRLALGPVRTFATAVVLRARPPDRLDEIKDRVRRATSRTIGARHADFHHHPYRPHLTLGYANTEVPERDLTAFRERLPAVDGHVQVDALRLVAVTRRDHGYRWDEVARVGLGLTGSASAAGRAVPEDGGEAERAAGCVRRAPEPAVHGRERLVLPGLLVARPAAGVQVVHQQRGHQHVGVAGSNTSTPNRWAPA